jgi:hypothetical protein
MRTDAQQSVVGWIETMDPRRVRQLQQQAEAQRRMQGAAAESSESEFATDASPGAASASDEGRRRLPNYNKHCDEALQTAGNNEATLGPSGPGVAARRVASSSSQADSAVRQTRAVHVLLMHVPLCVMLLVYNENVAASTDGWIVPSYVVAAFSLCAAICAMAEMRDTTKLFVGASLLLQGVVSGANYTSLESNPTGRFLVMAFIGYCAGQLRFLWAPRRLSRRMPHPLKARFANFSKRTTGFMPFLVLGETVGCAWFVPGGWLVISQSWYGYVLVFIFPFVLVPLSRTVSWTLTKLFGGDHVHVVGREDVTRLQLVRWTMAVTTATVLLIGTIAYFLVTYGIYAWANQLLMSPYAAFVEVLVYKALKANQRQRPPQHQYRTYLRRHDQLISDVMEKKKQYNIH